MPGKMTPEQWRIAGKTFKYRHQPIFYRDEGEGPALLCLHGFPTASWDWAAVWPGLREHFRLIAPDMIGYGFSAKPTDYTYTIADQATLHEALLDSLGLAAVHILAHDIGATVVQELLARLEERRRNTEPGLVIHSACLLNGALFPETMRPRVIQRLLLSPIGPLLGRLYNEGAFGRSFRPIFGPNTRPTDAEIGLFWELVTYNDGARIVHKLGQFIRERRRYRDRWVGALQETSVPLRLVNGPEDPISGIHMVERYRQLVPNPDVVLLEGIGHYPQVEDPDGVVTAVLAFTESEKA